MTDYKWKFTEDTTSIVGFQDAPAAFLEIPDMTDKRPNFKPMSIRLDLDTYNILMALQKLHGTRKNRSDLIRDAIVEKYERDRKTLTKDD